MISFGPAAFAAALASSQGGAAQGAVLLGVYSLGLGIPFLLSGLGFTRAAGLVPALRRRQRLIGMTAGGLLVVFGEPSRDASRRDLSGRRTCRVGTQRPRTRMAR